MFKQFSIYQVLIGALVAMLVPLGADAKQSMKVNPQGSGSKAGKAPATQSVTRGGKDGLYIRIINTCFSTNLRGVSNPLAPNSIITSTLGVMIGDQKYTVKVDYPALTTTSSPIPPGDPKVATSLLNLPADTFSVVNASNQKMDGAKAGVYGNTVQVLVPFKTGVSVDMKDVAQHSSGSVHSGPAIKVAAIPKVVIQSQSYFQTVLACGGPAVQHPLYKYLYSVPCGAYMGKTGTLSSSVTGVNVASDNSAVEIKVGFPGQTGFCGGWWSPVMLFFDEKRPMFLGKSSFPLNPLGKTAWPEENAPGFFLALDKDGDGKITKANELFGDHSGFDNGFEALKELDTNKNGKIDAKDKQFANLRMWHDKNGDGESQPEEISTLADHKVTSISLKYTNIEHPIGKFATQKQESDFTYVGADGKTKKGKAVDVWLKPSNPEILNAAVDSGADEK